MKLLCLQPYLMSQTVVNHIPHQENRIGYFDLMHASLLICSNASLTQSPSSSTAL